jgi:hypothetical protein
MWLQKDTPSCVTLTTGREFLAGCDPHDAEKYRVTSKKYQSGLAAGTNMGHC